MPCGGDQNGTVSSEELTTNAAKLPVSHPLLIPDPSMERQTLMNILRM